MTAREAACLFDKEVVRHRRSHLHLEEGWNRGVNGVLSMVILTLLIALAGGTLKTFGQIRLRIDPSAEVVPRRGIVNTLMVLALVMVANTAVAWFREGRVKVPFVVDAILIVLLTEVISQWANSANREPLPILCDILLMLGVVRTMAIHRGSTQGTRSKHI